MSSRSAVGGLPPYPKLRRDPAAGRLRRAAEILWGGMIVALLSVVCLVAITWVQSQGAVAIVRAQADAIRDGKVESAYGLFSEQYRAAMTLPMFRRWLRRQQPLASIRSLHIWRRSVVRDTAVLWGSFQDDLGHSYPIRYSLVRENGDWRIDSFQVRTERPEPLPSTGSFHYI